MVKAAYSAGKPALGVGAGNSPSYIERSANIRQSVADIIGSKTFDNGTICASEQSVVVDLSLIHIYCEQVEKYTNARGGKFQAGMYPVSANVLYGKDVMALPTGRLAKTPIADGVSPRAGYDTHGPTAAANSVSKLDHALASNGTLYNMKFLPSALAGDKGIKNMASLIRSYFERKGMHVQFNVVDRNTLIDAQNNPDKHKDLVIRVAGYSAHFTKLAKETQDNIIARTEMEF